MGKTYTVAFANKLDGEDNYGNVTYSVKFQDENDTALWKVSQSTTVEAGTTVFGRIDTPMSKNGKPYRKFVREQQEEMASQGQSASSSPQKSSGYAPKRVDNSDGMRQGMCINNAANYIASLKDGTAPVGAQNWASTVHEYATELYRLGDLKMEDPNEPVLVTDAQMEQPIDLSGIDSMFPGATQA